VLVVTSTATFSYRAVLTESPVLTTPSLKSTQGDVVGDDPKRVATNVTVTPPALGASSICEYICWPIASLRIWAMSVANLAAVLRERSAANMAFTLATPAAATMPAMAATAATSTAVNPRQGLPGLCMTDSIRASVPICQKCAELIHGKKCRWSV
jgi:hypothetical protein